MKTIGIIFTICLLFVGCNEEKNEVQEYVINGRAQGSTYAVKYFSTDNVVTKESLDSIFQVIDESMSTYLPTSMISRLNEGDNSVVVDDHFIKVLNASKVIFRESDSLFDPTVGILMDIYGFGPKKQTLRLNQEQLDSVLQYVGLQKIAVNEDSTIAKMYPESYLDFNSIAQGYSVDVLIDFLKSKGVQNAIVEVGGELAAIGVNEAKQKEWIVGIDDPLQDPNGERTLIAKIKLKNLGMATSGNYRKVKIDSITGEKYVHTMNPKTGKPQKGKLLSATILAPTTMRADGLATAFMVMDVEKSIEFLASHQDIYAYFIYMDEANEEQFYQTENFKKLVVE
ncbi:thiamine biosynthesis lipoprotein [Pustulibacterium marinum]|uniref:FAD:protein FMN transferase n=1 Tax=Pustulibacterium marinum TaxID=1224947 RepID=A0A1I7G6L7_9FLAO|nr:FAD:protein FMN transferase [Pustulibacterium marinum]SFU44063.1 thiamine biosynthesis lipoprotein [Pustulibacterium marinum]